MNGNEAEINWLMEVLPDADALRARVPSGPILRWVLPAEDLTDLGTPFPLRIAPSKWTGRRRWDFLKLWRIQVKTRKDLKIHRWSLPLSLGYKHCNKKPVVCQGHTWTLVCSRQDMCRQKDGLYMSDGVYWVKWRKSWGVPWWRTRWEHSVDYLMYQTLTTTY